jgi:hypothetical protein
MPLLIRGATRCASCERPISTEDEARAFPEFVWNERDPLFRFSDAVFHSSCLANEPLASAATKRLKDALDRLGPSSHVCKQCGKHIRLSKENFTFPYLTEVDTSPLYEFNFVQLHKQCLTSWREVPRALALLRGLQNSGSWRGPALERAIRELEAALRSD